MSASSSSPRLPSEPTALRIPARCSHFGSCGGCSLQDRPYEEQLRLKTRRVLAALSSIGELPVAGVHGSPDIWHYRNKMEYAFGDVYPPQPAGPFLKLGLKPKGRWHEILDLQECFLLSPETPMLLARLRAWAEERGVLPYNSHRQQGFLRHLVLREAKNTGERMVNLVTSGGDLPADSFVAAVREAYPATSILWGVNGKVSDTAVSDRLSTLFGPGHITEILRFDGRELKLRISAHSFFQTNTRGANLLYGQVREWVREAGPQTILDLYCGGGGIALSVADLCRKVVGAETHPAAIADGKANAERNGLSHVEFYSGAVETLLPALLALGPQVVISDPPRAGMHSQARAALAASGPSTLICVSCNPDSLARDLGELCGPYRVERLEIFDLFAHTEHVETAVLLRRK